MVQPLRVSILLLAGFFFSTVASAQLFRAYLASYGNDSNPCTVASPCRLLPAALGAVADGGEIWMLDSANYNSSSVAVTKSVSILAVPGQVGSVVAVGGQAALRIITPGITVGLRNIVIANNAVNPGIYGISMSHGTLSIEDSLFENVPQASLDVSGTDVVVDITRTVFRNGGWGIQALDGPIVSVANSQFINTGGIYASAAIAPSTVINVTDSTISNGAYFGLSAQSYASGSKASIFATRTTIQRSGYALDSESSGGSALVSCTSCTVVNNSIAYYVTGTGASIRSAGNNYFDSNQSPGAGSLTSNPMR